MNLQAFHRKSPCVVSACRLLATRARATALGVVLLTSAALAQDGQPKPPIDINQVQPKPVPQPAPAPEPGANGQPSPRGIPAQPGPTEEDRPGPYPVSRFILEYRTPHEGHPPIDDLLGAKVTLAVTPEGYVSHLTKDANGYVHPRSDMPSVDIRVGEIVEGSGGKFFSSAINEVEAGIVRELNSRGIIGVFVQVDPSEVDSQGKDLREGKSSEMHLIIWTARVQDVRTVASGERIGGDAASRVNPDDRVLNRIREQSPIAKDDLLRKNDMDDYVFRLNRHPGRRVDIAIAAGDSSEQVVVDYLVSEARPWSVYAQLSNTGTKATNEWRERFGFVDNQLTGHDDILRLDYTTGGFDKANSVTASYDFPLRSDRIHTRVYGAYSNFDASNVGLAGEAFTGTTYSAGFEASATFYQHRELFMEALAGLRWENVEVNDRGSQGKTNFVLPYFGARLDRTTEASNTNASIIMEFQVPEIAGTSSDELTRFARSNVDRHWETLKYSAEESFYLEPLLNPRAYRGEEPAAGGSLAHELAASVHGQYAFGNRLITNEEEVAGGMFSVRGYPESIVSGDNAIFGTAEYRFHVPRTFKVQPQPGHLAGREINWLGSDFRWAPQQPYGSADWDFILKAFVDAGDTRVNQPLPGEHSHGLVGAGVGMEVDVKRNVSVRLDLGVALDKLTTEANETIKAGDTRLHFSLTLLY